MRAVPQGHVGLLEITTSLLNDEEAETAPEDADQLQSSSDVILPQSPIHGGDDLAKRDERLGTDSDTASANSVTLTAGSDTLSVYSDPDTLDVQYEGEIQNEKEDCS